MEGDFHLTSYSAGPSIGHKVQHMVGAQQISLQIKKVGRSLSCQEADQEAHAKQDGPGAASLPHPWPWALGACGDATVCRLLFHMASHKSKSEASFQVRV